MTRILGIFGSAALLAQILVAANLWGGDETAPPPQSVVISVDATWSGEKTVTSEVKIEKATLTIEPGTVVTFKEAGRIYVGNGAALTAKGTADKPVKLIGDKTGSIGGHNGTVQLERCELVGIAAPDGNKRPTCIGLTPGAGGLLLRDCKLTDCGGITLSLNGPFTMAGCDIRRREGLYKGDGIGVSTYGPGKVLIENNTVDGMNVGVGAQADAVVRGNVVVRGSLGAYKTNSLLLEGNYVHQPKAAGTYGLTGAAGETRDNVIRGGAWVSAGLGGKVMNNVFISLPEALAKAPDGSRAPGGYDGNCTHEHLCGLQAGAEVARNIFVGQSYGAVMGIGDNTCAESVIRNNTFDMRGNGNPIFLNHLPKADPKGIVVRSNLFLRCGTVCDEKGVTDSAKQIDFNLWAAAPVKGGERFSKVTLTGKKPGDDGFGGHDVPPASAAALDPAAVVANPGVEFPFSDEEMLGRKHTVAEVLQVYRQAYALKKNSPAIDAGDPADKDDPAVKDGKPDIGAIESAK